jgi:hypothetical protein
LDFEKQGLSGMIRITPEIRKKMKLVAAIHALLAGICTSLVLFSAWTGYSRGITAFGILTAINFAGIALIAFFWKRGYV